MDIQGCYMSRSVEISAAVEPVQHYPHYPHHYPPDLFVAGEQPLRLLGSGLLLAVLGQIDPGDYAPLSHLDVVL